MKIRSMSKYSVPRYPRGVYYSKPGVLPKELTRAGALSVIAALVLQSCDGKGTQIAGVPAISPISEQVAQGVINGVFDRNGIDLDHDVLVRFERAAGDTVDLVVDGYNDSLAVGYEYLIGLDYSTFDHQVVAVLEDSALAKEPHITPIHNVDVNGPWQQTLETATQQFIDSLIARGVI